VKTFYATVIDINFVPMALALYRSFAPFLDSKTFGFFCVDDESANLLQKMSLPNAWVLRPDDFETEALKRVRAERAVNEYCWTLKSVALQTGLSIDPSFEWAVYLDSDMMTFADLDLALVNDAAIILAPHRFATPEFATYEPSVGRFNAGYVAFRNTPDGHAALSWWQEKCLERCPAIPDGDIYADQKYLDAMPGRFKGVVASEHRGLNVAPWNIGGYRLTDRGGQPFVDDDPVLLYHFQGLRILGARFFDLYTGPMRIPSSIRNLIYRPFIRSLKDSFETLRIHAPGFDKGIQRLTTRRTVSQLRRTLHGTGNLAIC
jgi:hypothetical protein